MHYIYIDFTSMKRCWFISLLLFVTSLSQGQIITSIIGNGTATNTGDGGSATSAGIYYPCGGVFDKYGNFYFAEGIGGFTVRKVSSSGIISTYAGTGFSGYSGDGGPATLAKMKNPQAVTVDTAGNLFIADEYDTRIRRVDAITGMISTVAGTGVAGYNGDGIAATAAQLAGPIDLCFDRMGNLYIADYGTGSRVRKINTLGIITTFAGTGYPSYGGDGGLADTTSINPPTGICFDTVGNLYMGDRHGYVQKVNTAGFISTYAGVGLSGSSGDGTPATSAMTEPYKLTFDRLGNLYIVEYGWNKIRLVNSMGIITTVAGTGVAGFSGDGGLATAAKMDHPAGITADSCNNLYIADSRTYYIRKVNFHPLCGMPDTATLGGIPINITGELSIYPNPVNDVLYISSPGKINSISICSFTGQTVYSHEYDRENVEVNVGALPTGVYFIKVNGKEVRKFVKEQQ